MVDQEEQLADDVVASVRPLLGRQVVVPIERVHGEQFVDRFEHGIDG
jgi:hypothetical protein